jgi:hypothetical protein
MRLFKYSAFQGSGLQSIRIPHLVEAIGTSCFWGSLNLSNVTFEQPCRVRRLEEQAMALCRSLPAICIPASVEFLGEACFRGCENLVSVTFEAGSKLATIGTIAFLFCTSLGPSIRLPSLLQSIPEKCFGNCRALTAVAFDANASLREIRRAAFVKASLSSFCVPASLLELSWIGLETVAEVAFESPSQLRRILDFDGGRLQSLYLPDSLESITVRRGGERGFVCHFGVNSQLRELHATHPLVQEFGRWVVGPQLAIRGCGFLRLSEPSLKRIRALDEYCHGLFIQ